MPTSEGLYTEQEMQERIAQAVTTATRTSRPTAAPTNSYDFLVAAITNTNEAIQRLTQLQATSVNAPSNLSAVGRRPTPFMDNRLQERATERRYERPTASTFPRAPPRNNRPFYQNRRDEPNHAQPQAPTHRPQAVFAPTPPRYDGPVPMQLAATQSTIPRKGSKISQAEHARRTANGLCLYCGIAGHLANACPSKTPRPAHLNAKVTTEPLASTTERPSGTRSGAATLSVFPSSGKGHPRA